MKPLSHKRAELIVLGILLGATLLAAGGCALLESWFNPPPENHRPIDAEEAAAILGAQETATQMCGSSSAEQAAAWLRQQGVVSDVGVADDGAVWIQYSCGLTGLVLPRDTLEGSGLNAAVLHEIPGDSHDHSSPTGGPKAARGTVSPTSKKAIILAFEPALSPGPGVALALRQAGFEPEAYVGSYFTLDRLRSLGEYGVVYISTHGRAGTFARWTDTTWFLTGETVPEELLNSVWSLWWRTAAIGIGISSIEGSPGSVFMINDRFLAREGVTMRNSLVLCSVCQSFMYNGMARAFVDAGAAVYAGWSNTSFANFSWEITERLLESLGQPGCTFTEAWAARNISVGDQPGLYSIPELFPMTVLENRDGDGEWSVRFHNGLELWDPGDIGAPDDYESDFVYLARSDSDDFVLVRSMPGPGAATKMYVTSTGTGVILRANLDGTGVENLGNLNGTLNLPQGIALDTAHGKLYVANLGSGTISRANLDGTGGEDLGNLNGTLNGPVGIALDVSQGKMYIVNNGSDAVSRANLDGTGGEDLGDLGGTLLGPWYIALDLVERRMYVTNSGGDCIRGHISRANLDGTGGEDLGNLNNTVCCPAGIALDLIRRKLYVGNPNTPIEAPLPGGTVCVSNLDGTGGEDLGDLGGTLDGASGIALDAATGRLYVADWGDNTLCRANLDGTGGEDLGNLGGGFNGPADIALWIEP